MGFYYNGISGELKDDINRLTAGTTTVKNEKGIEVFYDFAIMPKGLTLDTSFGSIVRLEPGITFSKTPGFSEVPGRPVLTVRGSSEAAWLDY